MKLSVLILTALMALVFSGCVSQPVTDAERGLFCGVSAFEDLGVSVPAELSNAAVVTKKVYYDSTFELQSEFTAPDDAETDIRFLSETYNFERRRADQFVNSTVQLTTFQTVLKSQGMNMQEEKAPDLGPNIHSVKYFTLQHSSGRAVGHYLICSGRYFNYSLTEVGFVMDNPANWQDILKPRLEKAGRFKLGLYKLTDGGEGK